MKNSAKNSASYSRMKTARAFVAGATLLLATAHAGHAQFTSTVFASGSAVSGTQPDSITIGGGHVFVEYGNGAISNAPLGTGGSSTIAEYDMAGNALATFSALGSVDGLRYNPATNLLWVLQNQDGFPALETIDPTNGLTTKYAYSNAVSTSSARGFDDVTFVGGKAYLSYTNPSAAGDAVIYSATLGNGTVNLGSPVLSYDGANSTTLNDPDSLDQTPNGSLLETSGDDGALTTVSNPGASSQTVSSVRLTDSVTGKNVSGLDDTVFAPSAASSLLVADTKNNAIYEVTGPFTPGGVYSSIGSTNTLDSVDLSTGIATSISTGLFPSNASPHGLGFLPAAAVPEASTTISFGLLVALGLGGLAVARKKAARAA